MTGTPIGAVDVMSMDANRIAVYLVNGMISVFDIPSSALVTFPIPAGDVGSTTPMIYGDKIVIASAPGLGPPSTLSYCLLPVPLAACGPWIPFAAGLPGIAFFALHGFPVFNRDVVAWPTAAGLSFYSFHSGAITAVPLAAIPNGISTNGDIISFEEAGFLNFIDTTDCIGPCVPPVTVTPFPADTLATGVSQSIIAFEEPLPVPLIRYYDLLTGAASPAGLGPAGALAPSVEPKVWGDRIAFRSKEADAGFDCNGDTVISAVDDCLRYWNIRNPSATLLPSNSPAMNPGGQRAYAIYDHYIAFAGPGGLKYVTVPMRGDGNQDGEVNIVDLVITAACFGKSIKNTIPPC